MITFKAKRSDGVATGWTYSVGVSGSDPLVTTDVVQALHMLEELGVEKPEDAVDQVRKAGLIQIHDHARSRRSKRT